MVLPTLQHGTYSGFTAAAMLGSEHNDEMCSSGFLRNHSGGIVGGISAGHDPCICPRIVPVVEAMTSLVLEDHYKRQAAMHN